MRGQKERKNEIEKVLNEVSNVNRKINDLEVFPKLQQKVKGILTRELRPFIRRARLDAVI